MVNTAQANQDIPYALLLVLRRVSAAIVVVLSLRITMTMYGVPMRDPHQALFIIVALMALIVFPGTNRDDVTAPHRFWSTSLSVFVRWCLMFGILLLLGYATKTSSVFSRKLLFTWLVVTPPLLVAALVVVDILIDRIILSADNARQVVIAGANDLGQTLAAKIKTSPHIGMTVRGFFDDRSVDRLPADPATPVLGNLQDLPEYVRKFGIDLIFIALPMRNIQRVTELLDGLHDTTVSIYYVPDIFVFDLIQCRTGDVDGLPVIALCETPFQGTQGIIKKFSDYVIASIVLLLTSPLFVAIALAIKLTTPGSIIFKQRRYGLDGEEITVYKFRSMSVSEDSDEVRQATLGDERITRVGAFLRKYSLEIGRAHV